MARKAHDGKGVKRSADEFRRCPICPDGQPTRECTTCQGTGVVSTKRQGEAGGTL